MQIKPFFLMLGQFKAYFSHPAHIVDEKSLNWIKDKVIAANSEYLRCVTYSTDTRRAVVFKLIIKILRAQNILIDRANLSIKTNHKLA